MQMIKSNEYFICFPSEISNENLKPCPDKKLQHFD